MSDVFKNIADAAGSSSVRRGFADLFSASKAALDEIQAGLGGILPSMPGMPVAKFGDLSIGIDMHPTVTPPSPIMPVPHVGKVYDLMADLMAGMAAAMPPAADGVAGVACNILKSMAPSVKVHNQWIAQAGIGIVHLPAFVLHPAGQRYVRVGDVDGQFHCPGGRCALFLPHTSGTFMQHCGNTDDSPQGKAQEGEQGPACPHFHALHHHIRRKSRACGRTAYH